MEEHKLFIMAKQEIKIGVTSCSRFFCLTACNLEATLSALGGAPPVNKNHSPLCCFCVPEKGTSCFWDVPLFIPEWRFTRKSLFPFLFFFSYQVKQASPHQILSVFITLREELEVVRKMNLVKYQIKPKKLKIDSVQPQNRNIFPVSSNNFYL